MVGTVSIGSKEGEKVEEARRRIELILDPPTSEVGEVYEGRVVNITKFGAFVNILPGRDGLVHISKLGRGKRIDRVEDVLSLGDELSVKVDDIDQNGKLSLSLVGDEADSGDGPSGNGAEARSESSRRPERPERPESRGESGGGRETASFEAFWEDEAREQFGDLGPAEESSASAGRGGDRGDRGGSRRGGRGGGRRGGGRR